MKGQDQRHLSAFQTLLQIFLRFSKIGIIGFGGGSALIPVIEREVVQQDSAFKEADYLEYTVIANITPGALPVKLGAMCGYQLGGAAGAMLGSYGVMLPGTLLTLALIVLFSRMGSQFITFFNYSSVGITAFIIMLLGSYILRVCGTKGCGRDWSICITAFFLTCGKEIRLLYAQLFSVPYEQLPPPLFDIGTIDLMLVSFLMIILISFSPPHWQVFLMGGLSSLYCLCKGCLSQFPGCQTASSALLGLQVLFLAVKALRQTTRRSIRNKNRGRVFQASAVKAVALLLLIPAALILAAELAFPGVPIRLFGDISLSTVTSFGGGEAYVSVADGFFVQGGYLDADAYYTQLIPVANALPGPILVKIASGAALLYGRSQFGAGAGWILGLTAACLSVGVCCGAALIVLQMYGAIEHSSFIHNLKRLILPVICGMLLSTSCSMLYEAIRITSERGIPAAAAAPVLLAGAVLLYLLQKKFHIHDIFLLLGAAASSLMALLAI